MRKIIDGGGAEVGIKPTGNIYHIMQARHLFITFIKLSFK